MGAEKTFTVTVDGESVVIPRKEVTPREILELAGLNSADRYLIEKIGSTTKSYRDVLDTPITVHQNQVFLSARGGSVPVS